MKRLSIVCVAALLAVSAAHAQAPPKHGPELDVLKKQVGTWDLTMKAGGQEFKGTETWKMELGGLWLSGNLECDMGGMKYAGHGMDTYDAAKKKYVGTWFDSMVTSPMTLEGTFDAAKNTMTMSGEGPGMDGKPTKQKIVTVWKDDDTMDFAMYMGDAKDPAFTILYKRKK